MSEDNKALVRRWFAEVDKGNPMIEEELLPPNGKVVTIQGIAIHRIAGGKLVEHWGVADKLSFLQQMDAIPPLA